METFLIINGVLLVLMAGALIWVRAVERKQKAAKAARAAANEKPRHGAAAENEEGGKEG